MSYWKKAVTCAASLAICIVLGAAPAAAADYPTSDFGPPIGGPEYGASWASGTLTWYDRGVHVKGVLRTAVGTGCRRVIGFADVAFDPRSSKPECTAGTHPIEFTIPADVRGGATWIQLCIDDEKDGGSGITPKCSENYFHPAQG